MGSADAKRFEVRCPRAFKRVVDAVQRYDGDATASALFRRLVLKRARGFAARNPNCQVAIALREFEGT